MAAGEHSTLAMALALAMLRHEADQEDEDLCLLSIQPSAFS